MSAQGTFATIAFTAKSASGDCPLGLLNVIVGNASGTSVAVTVTSGSVTIANHAPVLAPIGHKVVAERSAVSFTVSATDADGDSLTFSASGLPNGAAFDPATRTFSWTPTYDQSGSYTIRFQVTDGRSTDYEDVTITVGNMLRKDVNDDGSINVLDMIRRRTALGPDRPRRLDSRRYQRGRLSQCPRRHPDRPGLDRMIGGLK